MPSKYAADCLAVDPELVAELVDGGADLVAGDHLLDLGVGRLCLTVTLW